MEKPHKKNDPRRLASIRWLSRGNLAATGLLHVDAANSRGAPGAVTHRIGPVCDGRSVFGEATRTGKGIPWEMLNHSPGILILRTRVFIRYSARPLR